MLVVNRHTNSPTAGELHHMQEVAKKVFPGYRWRGPHDVPEHFNLHAEVRRVAEPE